jgi:hypothetical protein
VKVAPVAGRAARQGETRGSGAMIIDPYLAKRAARKVVTALADWWLTKVYDVHNMLEKAEVLPQSVGFETTNICNANCVFCAYQYQQRPTGVMDMSLCRRLTREVADLGILGLSFTPMVGDPLVDPYILERISLARDQGVKSTSLFTNGILFRKVGVDRILKSGLSELRLSTAGFDDASYRRIYRSTRYRQMYDALVELLERNEGMGHPVKVTIGIRADEPMSVIRRKPDFRRIARLVDGVDANLRFDSWSGRIAREELPAGMQLRRPPRKTYPCSMLYFGLTVLWDGRVSVCGCRDLDVGDDLLLGSAHSASLLELWSGSKLADLRRRWLHERQIPDVCEDCTHYQPATRYLRPDLKRQVETAALNGRSRETVTAHSAIGGPQGDGERF